MTTVRPLIVVVDRSEFDSARRELEADGWFCQTGFVPASAVWDISEQRIVCCGELGAEQDAMAAALAAARGAGLVVLDGSSPELTERLVEDLTRFGRVELRHRCEPDPLEGLPADQRRLLELVAQGVSLGEAARQLHISRRTADRRLAAARAALGVRTTAEALCLARCRATKR